MFLRTRNVFIRGGLRRHFLYTRPVPETQFASFSTSVVRCGSALAARQARPQAQASTHPIEHVPQSFSSIESLLHPHTLKAITETPYQHVNMSPVQERILGMVSELVDAEEGKDLLVRAKTGTGKTLAFLVPGIERRLKSMERAADEEIAKAGLTESVRARTLNRLGRQTMGMLIISPTRELATQIAVSATNLSMHHAKDGKGFGVQLLVGGESRARQMRDWVAGRKDVVVGTPGRLRDLLESWDWEPRTGRVRGEEKAHGLQDVFGNSGDCVVVLDEADTLLDMGFRRDVEAIADCLKKSRARQTWMFSATVGKGVEGIVREVMRKGKWEYVDCIKKGEEKDVHSHVRQMHTIIGDGGGMAAFVHLVRLIVHDQLSVMKRNREGQKAMRSKMLVFFSTTKMTSLFGKLLRACARQWSTFPFKTRLYEMHSKKDMKDRVRISSEFRDKPVPQDEGVVMVSSDVSARGVDYPNVTRVVQMGIPGSREGYVHRVGRTGRGDVKEGRGDLVLAPWEMGFLKVLGDVGMEPVTVEDLKTSLETMVEELEGEQGPLRKMIAGIEDMAKNIAQVDSGKRENVVDSYEYRSAWSSMAGFYVGNGEALGLDLHKVVEGSGRWVEQLGGLESGLLGVGPDSGLPNAVMTRLRQSERKNDGRRKEKAWGSFSGKQNRQPNDGWKKEKTWASYGGERNQRSNDGRRKTWGSNSDEQSNDSDGRRKERTYSGEQNQRAGDGRRQEKSWGSKQNQQASWMGRGSSRSKPSRW